VLARNAIESWLLQVAASRAGVVLVPLNPRSTVVEWDQVVRDAQAMLLVCGPGFDGAALPAMPVTGFDELFAAGPATAPDHPGTTELLRLYTGGTTGRPRGASLSQRAVTSAMTQIAAGPHGGRPGERTLVVAPLSHAGAVWSALAPLVWGAGLVIAESTEPADWSGRSTSCASATPRWSRRCSRRWSTSRRAGRAYPALPDHTGSAGTARTLRRATEVFRCAVVQGYG
jgi:fatty-acyl-CoA synthase